MRRGGIFAQWGTGPQRALEEDLALTPVDGDADKTLLRAAAEETPEVHRSARALAPAARTATAGPRSSARASRAESSVSSYSNSSRSWVCRLHHGRMARRAA